jgi:hypothetical protein
MSSYPVRHVGEHVPPCAGRLELRSTTRRHRALVRGEEAAVVLGVLGYDPDVPTARVPADELITRARAWQAEHDPAAVPDPGSAGAVDWDADPEAARAYRHQPHDYRTAFLAFTLTGGRARPGDWITWQPR